MDTLAAHPQHEEVSMTDGLSVGVSVCVCARVYFQPNDNQTTL